MARGTIGLGANSSGITPISGTVDIGIVSGTVTVSGTVDVGIVSGTVTVQGLDLDASASLANPVVVGAKYFAVPEDHTGSIDDGDTTVLRTDRLRDLMVSLATAIAGENIDANLLEVGSVGSYYAITSSGAHQISSNEGVLLKLHYVTPYSGSNLTIYDGTTVSTAAVMVPRHSTSEQELPGNVPYTVDYGFKFTSGLIIDVTGSLQATVVYKEEN